MRVPVIFLTIRDKKTAKKVSESGRIIIIEGFDIDEVRGGSRI